MSANENEKQKWRFTQLGGFDQVELSRSEDLVNLPDLDHKLWATLSCPTHGLYFDAKTLAFLDTDQDGRIKANELTAAVSWVAKVLKNPADLLHTHSNLPLAAINEADPEGQQLLSSAKEILKNLGKPDATALEFDDIADISRIFADTRFNGDGVIPVKAAVDEAGKQAIADIMKCCGEEMDRSGDPGINLEKIELFFKQALAYTDWQNAKQGVQVASLPTGVEVAGELVCQLKGKLDDYFTRCQLAEFDERAAELLNPAQTQYEQLAGTDLSTKHMELEALPLAAIIAGKDLPLSKGLNPAWRDLVLRLKQEVLTPLFGELESLSFQQWQSITAQFAEFERWQQKKPVNIIESLGASRIKELLESEQQKHLISLIDQDMAVAAEAEAIDAVIRLLHYYRDLYTLLNNFVSFRDFYNPQPHAIFQAGVLYLDGRSCQLCVKVDDVEKHSSLASLSKIFLAYCECRRLASKETITIVAAFTGGDSDNLMVGRNGVFYDRDGRDWDATIVKIIENPISVAQAFWAPYKSVARMINAQLEKSAAARDKAANENAFKEVSTAGSQVADAKTTAPAPAFDVGKFAGIFAAIGLAIGAIGTMLASVIGGFMSLQWWQMPLAILGLMLLISGPSMFMAFLKLRQRNLAPVLDACGWAVNAKAFINIPFGRLLTGVAKLPSGAERQLADPFAEKQTPWGSYFLLLFLLLAGYLAWENGYLLGGHKDHTNAEAAKLEVKATGPETKVAPAQPEKAISPDKK